MPRRPKADEGGQRGSPRLAGLGLGSQPRVMPAAREHGFEPRIDVEETDDELRVTAELPGLEEKDFDVLNLVNT